MRRTLKALFFVSLFSSLVIASSACATTTVLYDGKSTTAQIKQERVKVILVGTPEVTKTSFEILFKFESPTDDSYVIQQIELNKRWIGIEAFKVYGGEFPLGQRDRHHSSDITKQGRRMTVIPGEIEGADESTLGFAMLPSGWSDGFNEAYRKNHKIKGRIVKMVPEAAISYILNFDNGVLTFQVEGTDIRHTWTAE